MEFEDLHYFNPYGDIRQTQNRLPHWHQLGAVYFVTFHLGDALPETLLSQWQVDREAWLRLYPEPWTSAMEREYHRQFSAAKERWLDAGHGSCLLRETECARRVAEALAFFDGRRCVQIAWVVMPNHVHAVCGLHPDWRLEQLVHSWKRHSARQINQLVGRRGAFWQRDYFDRLVRDGAHLENCVRYIRRNPEQARLQPGNYLSFENELARKIQ